MVQTANLRQLAQQGYPQAIATLINHKLQPTGITAKVVIKEQTLKILLEGSVVPDQATLTAFVLKGVTSLQIQTVNRLQVFGKSMDQAKPTWTQVYPLNSISAESEVARRNSARKVDPISVQEKSEAAEALSSSSSEEIEALLNRVIADEQITIKATQEDKLLKIIVETNKVLEGQSFASKIYQELKTVDLSKFETLSVYKQKLKGSHSFQLKSFSLVEQDEPQPNATELEDALQLSSNDSNRSLTRGVSSNVKDQSTAKPKLKIGRLISVAVIGVLAALFIIRTLKRMIVIVSLSPALGSFSVILGLAVLWRAWCVLNPMLQALLRDE
jgi:hypothetical protein